MMIVKIPGGEATLRDKIVSERHHRQLERAGMKVAPVLKKLQPIVGDIEGQSTAETADATDTALALAALSDDMPTLNDTELDLLYELQDTIIILFLESWTLPKPIPTLETIQDLDRETYTALSEATKTLGAEVMTQTPDFSPTPDKTTPDGKVNPTGSSNTSNGHSKVRAITK